MGTSSLPTPNGSGAMFDQIARRYDLLNRCTSLGLDRRWRRRLLDALAPETLPAKSHVLDVATGTADVALALLRRAPHVWVTGIDPSVHMLAEGRHKWNAQRSGRDAAALALCEGDAEHLPERAGGWAGATMAFGIRNVPDRPAALAELRRVLAPGARLVILELTEPARGPLAWGARIWVHRVVPWLGGLLSGASAYRYLAASIAAFPPGASFATTIEAAGFVDVRAERLSFGAAHVFVATAPDAALSVDKAPA